MNRSPSKDTPSRGRSRSRKPTHRTPAPAAKTVDAAPSTSRVATKVKESKPADETTRRAQTLRNLLTLSSLSLFALGAYFVARTPAVRVSQTLGFPTISESSAPFGAPHVKLFRRIDLGWLLVSAIFSHAIGDGVVAAIGWNNISYLKDMFFVKKVNWIRRISCPASVFFMNLLFSCLYGVYDMHLQFLSASLMAFSIVLFYALESFPQDDDKKTKSLRCWLNTAYYVTMTLAMATPLCYLMTAYHVMPLWIWCVAISSMVISFAYDWSHCCYVQKKCDFANKEICDTYTTFLLMITVGFSVHCGLSY